MRRISITQQTLADWGADIIPIVILRPPPVDSALFRIEIRGDIPTAVDFTMADEFDDLGTSTPHYFTGGGAGGFFFVIERALDAAQGNLTISLQDVNNGAGTLTIGVFRLDEDQLPAPPAYLVPKATTTVPLEFRIGRSAPTSTPVVTLLKNGVGGFVAATGAITNVTNGWFRLTPSALDTGTEGPLLLKATLAASPSNVEVTTFALYQVFTDDAIDQLAAAAHGLSDEQLQQILDAINGSDTPGGKIPYLVHVQAQGGAPIDNAEVWATTDPAGLHVVDGTTSSNSNGDATLLLDPGDYYAWAESGGKKHIAAQPFTVGG